MSQYNIISSAAREELEKQGVADKVNIDKLTIAIMTALTVGRR